ncbi:metallophosphoesterase N-terminal domain-containing protein [Hymenobacter cellulosilyticus]|uniref:Metallophosphoesterase n=1 Tax=Hymenobacter cellulosilyticus TaxID=2932248 RepID=A0A8T9Q006_9BACT|nr:metallophosphoesterase N-terminal domain-containing protein [Hymenobacter cellulosilyticus]UOQ70172.1 metallophosphoesterase [Hymenobacter cellulosilyticus]
MGNSFVRYAWPWLFGLLAAQAPAQSQHFTPRTVAGTVFVDQNGNGRREAAEAGVAGVLVSNGVEIVPTDTQGRYRLSTRPGRLVFVVKPRGYAPVRPEGWYYQPTTASRQTADFALRLAVEKNAHQVVLLGDIQAGSQDDLYHFNHLVTEELYDDPYAFALTLGDITFDELGVYPKTKASLAALGKPVYAVFGNHDQNYEVREAAYADSTYQRYFGPSYYALQYGRTHFIVLNDVACLGQKKYEGRVSSEQLTFLTNYLQHSDPSSCTCWPCTFPWPK